MKNNYICVPATTSLKEIMDKGFTLSAAQHKTFCVKNSNLVLVSDFLDKELSRADLGYEVGSEEYVDFSPYIFIKTKALQEESYLINEVKDSMEYITSKSFIQMNLKRGDLLISKDSNVGETIILDRDYSNAMLCGGIYRLPVKKFKYYLLAFLKNDLFRQQIDFMVPRGSTIRHGKKKFLECKIPMPNKNIEQTIEYIECLVEAIINKEIAIKDKYNKAMLFIDEELNLRQKDLKYKFQFPTIKELQMIDRMDSSLYSDEFKKSEFLIKNYEYGFSTIQELGFSISRGQNLQVSNIGISVRTSENKKGYYKLILPNYISKYGTVTKTEYLGNTFKLKTLNMGDIIFGAEGNEKGRSYVVIKSEDNAITNIHGIILNHLEKDIKKSVFVKLFLDYYRKNGMIDAYAVGGNGGSMAIKYWDFIKFPNFPPKTEDKLSSFYYNYEEYSVGGLSLDKFKKYDSDFNDKAGIYEIDMSLKYLQKLLDYAIKQIADDKEVEIVF